MTVAWGSMGVMWGKPFAQVVVRPVRYTFEFMEQYDSFTLCAFPAEYRQTLLMLGTKSGRDGDKIAESGLTPVVSANVAAPGFAEAELIVELR
jgi:flavin reductase (DIM6/NTAB) family NADH-FMN oxidoreductase RutF